MKCHSNLFSCLWPKSANGAVEIPVVIDENYDNNEWNEILSALMIFHAKTCIRFIPRVMQKAYISIEPRYGCISSLGRLGDRQVVSLQRNGCVRRDIVQHELMHALGFIHEHTRSDRDHYVQINWDNIREDNFEDFELINSNNLNTPYDYTSIMHYG
ncbi:hypothetical protein LDENG_00017110, partial [Lucifuga dentata]